MPAPSIPLLRHPKAAEFAHVFTGIQSFIEIRRRIEWLSTAHEKGTTFEVLTHALAATAPLSRSTGFGSRPRKPLRTSWPI